MMCHVIVIPSYNTERGNLATDSSWFVTASETQFYVIDNLFILTIIPDKPFVIILLKNTMLN